MLVALLVAISPSFALAESKPNIVFLMGDEIGMWNIGAYHSGLMAERTPNIDKHIEAKMASRQASNGSVGIAPAEAFRLAAGTSA